MKKRDSIYVVAVVIIVCIVLGAIWYQDTHKNPVETITEPPTVQSEDVPDCLIGQSVGPCICHGEVKTGPYGVTTCEDVKG